MEEFVYIVMQNFFVPFIPFSAFGQVHQKCVNYGFIYCSCSDQFAGIKFFVECVFIKILSIEKEYFGERSLRKINIGDAIGGKNTWYFLYRFLNELFLFWGRFDGMGICMKFVKVFSAKCIVCSLNRFRSFLGEEKTVDLLCIQRRLLIFVRHMFLYYTIIF